MACGLTVEELFILNVLYHHRCVRCNRSKNLGEIANAFRAKFKKNPEDMAKILVNKGYVAPIKKKILNIIYPAWRWPVTLSIFTDIMRRQGEFFLEGIESCKIDLTSMSKPLYIKKSNS